MSKPTPKTFRISFEVNAAKMQRRARQYVEKLVSHHGYTHDDIAQVLETTVASLIEGSTDQLTPKQFNLLQSEFGCSLIWLWYGFGPVGIENVKEIKQLNAQLS